MLDRISRIERMMGRVDGLNQPRPKPYLRKSNRVRTVQGSLAIEGNTLTLEQITAILDGKRIIGDQNEIREVKNAIAVYDQLPEFNPYRIKDFLRAHRLMMDGLIDSAGRWRSGNVGIFKGEQVSHIAPKADRVEWLMQDLFKYLKDEPAHQIIKGCVGHYEIEFIHPFEDGNGRMGRLWHSVLLRAYHPIFEFIPVESIIKNHQQEYYQALEGSDKAGNSTVFIEFILNIIEEALSDFMDALEPVVATAESRLQVARQTFGLESFSRKDYLNCLKTISTATASRDLLGAVADGVLKKLGSKAQTRYQFAE